MRRRPLFLIGLILLIVGSLWFYGREASVVPEDAPVLQTVPSNARPLPHRIERPAPRDGRLPMAAEEFQFNDPRLGALFRKLDRAVRLRPDPGWIRVTGDRYDPQHWNDSTWDCVWESPACDIRMEVFGRTGAAEGFQVQIRSGRVGKNGILLSYGLGRRPSFGLYFDRPGLPVDVTGSRRFGVSPGDASFRGRFEDPERIYEVTIPASFPRPPVTAKEIVPYFRSAETFREAATKELQRLENEGRERILAGSAIGYDRNRRRRGNDPPYYQPFGPGRVPDDAMRRARDLFEATMEARLELIHSHFAEMSADLNALFPELREVVLSAAEPP